MSPGEEGQSSQTGFSRNPLVGVVVAGLLGFGGIYYTTHHDDSAAAEALRLSACTDFANAQSRVSVAINNVVDQIVAEGEGDTRAPKRLQAGYGSASSELVTAGADLAPAAAKYTAAGFSLPPDEDLSVVLSEVEGIVSDLPAELDSHATQKLRSDLIALPDRAAVFAKYAKETADSCGT